MTTPLPHTFTDPPRILADPINNTDAVRLGWASPRAMPAGGAVGQVLTKNSATDRDASWADPASPGAVSAVFRGRANAAQTMSATVNAWTTITFPVEDYDTDNGHSTSTNTGRYVAQRAGYYRVTGMVPWAASATTYRRLRVTKNGALWPSSQGGAPGGSADTPFSSVDTLVYLAVGDYVEIQAASGTASSVTAYSTTSGAEVSALMEVTLLQAASNADLLPTTTPRGLVGRNTKADSGQIAVTTAEKPILSCSAPVVAGRSYMITARAEIDCTAPPMTSASVIRYTTNGVEPTVSSTQLRRTLTDHRPTSVPDEVEVVGIFDATATGTLKALLSVSRAIGTGQITVRADGQPIDMWIEDVGLTVAATGQVYT